MWQPDTAISGPRQDCSPRERFNLSMKNIYLGLVAVITFAAVALLGAGCASVFNGGDRTITINSQPIGAKILVAKSNTGEEIRSGVTPLIVSLPPKAGYFRGQSYSVSFKLTGYQTTTVQVRPSISGWYFANIILGGAIGMVVVDPLTGSMWNLSPDKIQETLSPAQASLIKDGNGFIVVLASAVTEQERKDMVRIR